MSLQVQIHNPLMMSRVSSTLSTQTFTPGALTISSRSWRRRVQLTIELHLFQATTSYQHMFGRTSLVRNIDSSAPTTSTSWPRPKHSNAVAPRQPSETLCSHCGTRGLGAPSFSSGPGCPKLGLR